MDMNLVVDLIHSLAFISLAIFCVVLNSEMRLLKQYVAIVAKNPTKARRLNFEKFKKEQKQWNRKII